MTAQAPAAKPREPAAPRETRSRDLLSWLIRGSTPAASHSLLAPATIWLLAFLVLPVGTLLLLGFAQRGPYGTFLWAFTWDNFLRALQPKYLPVLLRTLGFASAATLVCLVLGFPVAYYLSFGAGRRKEALLVLLMVPFWTSCLVSIYSWIIILGREGLLNGVLLKLGLIATPLTLINTNFSVVLGLVYFYVPFMILPLYSSLEKIPRALIEASQDLGAGTWTTFRKVTLPLCLPGVLAGCLLTFIPCMGDFLTAEFLGGPKTYLIGNLIQNQFLMAQDWPFGSALTALLVLFLVSGLLLHQRLERQGGGLLMRGRGLPSYVGAFYAFLYLPLAVMFAFSFNDARRNVAWRGFTLKWYASLFHNAELLHALTTTLKLAVTASVIASLLGLLASYAMTRHAPFRGRAVYAGLLSVPLMMPEIVMGVGLLSFFVRARIPLNFWTLACAHAVIALPYSASAIRARLLSLKDSRLEEAAMDLGATEWQAFVKITLPLARPAIVSGALLAFTVSFEDFVTSFFIAGIGIVTMPIKIYSMMKFGVTPEINALACSLLALTVVLLLLVHPTGREGREAASAKA